MAPRTEAEQLLTYEEVANILRLHPQTLRQWVSNGKFPHLKIGVTVRFTRAMIDQYIRSSLIRSDLAKGNLNTLGGSENDLSQEECHD